MKYLHYLFLGIIMLPLLCDAQTNYKRGYVINIKGDTIAGLIDYRGWDSNPDKIYFKAAPQDKPSEFDTNTISYFSVDGVTAYQKFSLNISMDAVNINVLSSYRDTSYKQATVFLQILQKGKNLALYSYTDAVKTRCFIAEAPDYRPVELIYRIYNDPGAVTYTHGKTVNEDTYKKQLFNLAVKYNKDTEILKRDIENANYTPSDLLDIVSKINEYDKAVEKRNNYLYPATIYFVGAGVNIATTISDAGTPYSLSGGKANTSLFPKVTLGFNTFGNPVTRRLVLAGEVGFTGNIYNVKYNNVLAPYGTYHYKFNQYTASLNLQILYNLYNSEKLKIFAGGGYYLGFSSYGNKEFADENGHNDLVVQPFSFGSTETNFLTKAGVLINKKFEIYADYLFADYISSDNDNYFLLKSQALQFGINYHFR